MPRPSALGLPALHRAALAVVTLGLAGSGVAACAGSEPGPAPTGAGPGGSPETSAVARPVVNPTIRLPRTTAPTADPASTPDPTIATFTLTPADACDGDRRTITADVQTTGADRIVLVVDDVQLDQALPTTGSIPFTVACDDRAHYALLIAANPANETASDQQFTAGPH